MAQTKKLNKFRSIAGETFGFTEYIRFKTRPEIMQHIITTSALLRVSREMLFDVYMSQVMHLSYIELNKMIHDRFRKNMVNVPKIKKIPGTKYENKP